MEIKKSPEANLENKRNLFTEIGLVIALLLVLIAFEWKSYNSNVTLMEHSGQAITEEEMVPITQPNLPPPPQIPLPKPVVVSDVIKIVNDNVKVETIVIASAEEKNIPVIEYAKTEVEEEEVEEDIPFAIVEEKPKFMGGDESEFGKWVYTQITYPDLAKENKIEGRVMVSFIVNAEGKVVNVKILRGVDASLDHEALRVISSSPKWTPGKQRNKTVRVQYNFPVIFKLR